jgi:hypothetical protein
MGDISIVDLIAIAPIIIGTILWTVLPPGGLSDQRSDPDDGLPLR